MRSNGIGFAVVGSETSPAAGEHERSFGFFRAHPPGQASLNGQVEGSTAYSAYFSGVKAYQMARPQATTVNAILRTSTVYVDRNVVTVTYQVRDDFGNTDVDSSLGVTAEVVHEDGSLTTTGSCSWVFQAGGVGECSIGLGSNWFDSTASASVTVTLSYSGAEVASSSAGTVDLVEAPVHPTLAAAGMAATMVLSPMFVDEMFAVEIVAHTGDPSYALAAWQLTFLYDETVLELQSTIFSTLFKDVTLNDQTAGQVIATRPIGRRRRRESGE